MIDIFAVKAFNLRVNRLGGKMNLSLSNEYLNILIYYRLDLIRIVIYWLLYILIGYIVTVTLLLYYIIDSFDSFDFVNI